MFGVPDMPLGECFLQREAPLGSPVEKAFSTRQRDLFAGLDQGLNQDQSGTQLDPPTCLECLIGSSRAQHDSAHGGMTKLRLK